MNTLYPIFVKTENIKILIVGAGKVAQEKLSFLLKSSPNAQITIIAKDISLLVMQTVKDNDNLFFMEKPFQSNDIEGHSMVIAATNDDEVNRLIYNAAKEKNILVNVADTPEQCDFYLGAIVTKGDLKIAISTNGKSPTMAKRIREWLEDILPDNLQTLLENLHNLRKQHKGTFKQKVKYLTDITGKLNPKHTGEGY